MVIYAESKELVKEIHFEGNDFSGLPNVILGNGVMLYGIIDGKEELIYVYYQKKQIKRGELTIEILKNIQNQNKDRNAQELTTLINNFNLVNE